MKARSQYLLIGAIGGSLALGGCVAPRAVVTESAAKPAEIVRVVAVERVYGDIASQLGGAGVSVTTILNSPDADPHGYEPSARDADAVGGADIVIENGLGYDAFAEKLLAASPSANRQVITVGAFAHRVGDNPHVWYEPATLRAFTTELAASLSKRLPKARATIALRRNAILAWTQNLAARLSRLGVEHPTARVAITEPVFDYILHAAHVTIATPPAFSHAIEEGNDPAPQDVDAMQALLSNRRVAAFVYNRQTVEPATTRLLAIVSTAHVTIVPVTETLPAGETTQIWIDGEVGDLERAL